MLAIEAFRDDDLPALRTLVTHPSLAEEHDYFAAPGMIEHVMRDPLNDRRLAFLARLDGAVVGFTTGYRLPQADGSRHAFLRLGAHGDSRRRGVGSALLGRALEVMREMPETERPRDVAVNHWVPNPAAEGFAMRYGFHTVRHFWRMQRDPDATVGPRWPLGIEPRPFDGSETAIAEWTDVVNDSFAAHYRFDPATNAMGRSIVTAPDFRPEYLMLAYRGEQCVGFCRNEVVGDTGVIGVLGVARAARGIGLGRALLRWGVGALSAQGFGRVALYVDGENENALSLYRSEGFTVERTRRFWERLV